jgi:RNA polymerase sigma-70 factor, ECF subfamily
MNTLLSVFPWTELRRFVQSQVPDPQQADDLVQEVAIAVWTKGESLRVPGAFKAWVFSIARRKVATSYRSKKAERTALRRYAELRRAENNHPDTTECRAAVRSALREIPGNYAQVLILRLWHGLTYGNICSTLGGTEVGVRTLAHRARKALKGQLEALPA